MKTPLLFRGRSPIHTRRKMALLLGLSVPVLALTCLLLRPDGSDAQAGTLRVRVLDGRNGQALTGAYVQVGPAPSDPFSSNWGWTASDGTIQFSDPLLTDVRTITAGFNDFALLTVFGVSADSITLALHRQVAESTLPEPKAEIGGAVTGVTVQNNDGNLDIAVVYPAVALSDLLAQRVVPFEVPPDTVSFPVVGSTVIPGNVVVPTQVEFLFLTYSKPHYHLFVPQPAAYDFVALAGRMPISALASAGLPINQLIMRQIGASRDIQVNGSLSLNLTCDLSLAHTLTVRMPEAPNGSKVFAAAVGDLPAAPSPRSIFFDGKSALRDTLTALHLSGMMPAGDLGDLVAYVTGYYGDSSSANTYQAGRVDRSPLILPATRTLSGFFLLPEMSQVGDQYQWTDVARPGATPDPTWGVSALRLDAIAAGDSTVVPRTIWEVWVPASARSFRLPALAPGAPGELPDPAQTPEADRLLWDLWLADASGSLQEILGDAFSTLTCWSRRTVEVQHPTAVEEVALGTRTGRVLKFRIAPNPGSLTRDILWDRPPRAGQQASWGLWDPAGRRLASGNFTTSGRARDIAAVLGTGRLQTGIYWVKVSVAGRSGAQPLLITR